MQGIGHFYFALTALKSRAPRKRGSRTYEVWRQNIANGMREAKLKRRQAGLMTPTEVGVELGLSRRSVEDLFPVIVAGTRKYIRRREVERWKTETGTDAA